MASRQQRRHPLPIILTFMPCDAIFRDARTGVVTLLNPINHMRLGQFPGKARLSLFLELAGGHASYLPRLVLRDGEDTVVWDYRATECFKHDEPLVPHQVMFHDLILDVPRPGRYLLSLLLDDEEAVQRALAFSPIAPH